MISAEETHRLALVKYYLEPGTQQAKHPEPLSSVAILLLHDATELFVQLAAEHLNAKTSKNTEFIGYWDAIATALGANELPKREAMKRMNAARVALKHAGTLPAHREISGFASMVNDFFDESTPLVFGVNLDSVSLCDLVICEPVRSGLKRAEDARKNGNLSEALGACATSFDDLVRDYERRKTERFGRSPFYFGGSMAFLSSSAMGIERTGEDRELARFVDTVRESVEAMQEGLKVLSLGLDYRRYARFRLLTPAVLQLGRGARTLQWLRNTSLEPVKLDEVSFCVSFVIESALRLQEFDYDLGSGA
jgi:hypothetical protein